MNKIDLLGSVTEAEAGRKLFFENMWNVRSVPRGGSIGLTKEMLC